MLYTIVWKRKFNLLFLPKKELFSHRLRHAFDFFGKDPNCFIVYCFSHTGTSFIYLFMLIILQKCCR